MTRNHPALRDVGAFALVSFVLSSCLTAAAPAGDAGKADGPHALLFKGDVEIRGRVLTATYDFSDEAQLGDFVFRSAQATIVNGELDLNDKLDGIPSSFYMHFKDVVFRDAVVVEMDVILQKLTNPHLIVAVFHDEGFNRGYRFLLNSPDGRSKRRRHAVVKDTQQSETHFRRRTLADTTRPAVAAGTKYRLKVVARRGALQLLLNGVPLVSKADGEIRDGLLIIGGRGGAIRIDNLKIQGQVDADWLKKALAAAKVAKPEPEGDDPPKQP
jgi:hypothetical protein